METPPPSKICGDKDIISALPDELLLGILERLGLRQAVRAGVVSKRWRHLPHQLSRVDLDVGDFQGATPLETMDTFTGAVCRLLSACAPPAQCKCDCESRRAIKILRLCFYLSDPHLGAIGRAVENTVSRGDTDSFELTSLIPHSSDLLAPRQTERGQTFMSFSRACPVAFRWLTGLSLKSLEFGDSDLPNLLSACDKLKHLSLRSCRLARHSVLKIDVPSSFIDKLEFIHFRCRHIELVSVPKLTELVCHSWRLDKTRLHFGYVPELLTVHLASRAKAPFALSKFFSMNTRSLSNLYLSFGCQPIWIRPEDPKQLTPMFGNLTHLVLWAIFPECDLTWTLFFLEAAPALQKFTLNRARHCCVETPKDSAVKMNLVWQPSKDLKHRNLELLVMMGFEEEGKVTNYIRLVMERCVALKRIKLRGTTCEACNDIDPEIMRRRSKVDKASRGRVKEQLTHASSSSVNIIIC